MRKTVWLPAETVMVLPARRVPSAAYILNMTGALDVLGFTMAIPAVASSAAEKRRGKLRARAKISIHFNSYIDHYAQCSAMGQPTWLSSAAAGLETTCS
jgi:hypothetical protein